MSLILKFDTAKPAPAPPALAEMDAYVSNTVTTRLLVRETAYPIIQVEIARGTPITFQFNGSFDQLRTLETTHTLTAQELTDIQATIALLWTNL